MEGNNAITRRTSSTVKEILEQDFATLPKAYDLYAEFVGQSEIEKHEEEIFVITELLKGKDEESILDDLKKKYPGEEKKFTPKDFIKFLERHKEISSKFEQYKSLTAKRHLEARVQCSEVLASLALYTQKLVVDLRNEGDNSNAIAAIRVLNQTLQSYMELEGLLKPKSDSIGVQQNVINLVSDKFDLRERAHKADFHVVDEDSSK